MNQRILLITGWGGGTKLLHPLKQALVAQGHDVELCNIFNALDEQALQQKVELARQFDVIVGWSLGGQLATLLVDQIQKQHGLEKVLITLGSNPCFVANETWPTAMDQQTFQQFKQSFEQDAVATLKKFGYMVCQGTETTKADFITLQSLIQAQNLETLREGLNCLEQLNNVDILKNYSGHQYHVFAKQDFLVSYKVQRNFQKFNAKFLETELVSGSHGFPLFEAELITGKICHFLQKIEQTTG
ncbi:YqiA/YcfP family alpha/beta fold hydrolase [Acinetobacter bouvetii]|uniref:Pimeloyl-[acyl-carrier protein] methyl ester esterase n=1 Tax=Acinetobacter bouvetii TaxID=202951 RepID=A0A811GCM4_9GAMM|nr:YqiA/YcfP family alpha/beta fold hydrolase [Acinetobacter bouvetii]CAB1216764.1 Pimeloyl-[acyl-carrier protein] methyl ester esterase [Acinetobacter bouvetii]